MEVRLATFEWLTLFHLCWAHFFLGENRILYITPEYISVVTTQNSYHAGLFPVSFLNSVIDSSGLWSIVSLKCLTHQWLPCACQNERRRWLWMWAEGHAFSPGHFSCPRYGQLHIVQKNFLYVLIPLFKIMSLLVLKTYNNFSCFEFLLTLRFRVSQRNGAHL